MSDTALERLRDRAQQRPFAGRSEAYRWLRRRHAALAALFEEFRPAWAEVTAEMVASGITGGRGIPLTPNAVRRIWKTVCRDVAEAARQRALSPKVPAGWAPVPVAIVPAPVERLPAPPPAAAPLPASMPVAHRPSVPAQSSGIPAPVRTPEEIKADLEAVRRQMRGDQKYLPGANKLSARRP